MKRNTLFFRLFLFWTLALLLAACNLPQPSAEDEAPTPSGGDAAAVTDRTPITPPSAPSNTDGAPTAFVPGGTFLMGSPADDAAADTDEMPQHAVTLTGFYIYRNEVTNAMYAECVAAGGCSPVQPAESGPISHYDDPSYADHPVVGVTWRMASEYCRWAGGRLPSEAEWELAARSVDNFRYPWGSEDPTCERANFAGCQSPPDTLVVGSLAAGNSPYDLWDMSGNVWEWVQDWYAPNYYTFSAKTNPLGPYVYQDKDRPLKAVRGGGLFSGLDNLRAAARLGINPYVAYEDVGFRCVAGEPNDLPAPYVDPGPGVEFVPSPRAEGGEPRAEDPVAEPTLSIRGIGASCVTPEGQIYIGILFQGEDAPFVGDELIEVEGREGYRCRQERFPSGDFALICNGPAPEGYPEDPNPLDVYVGYENERLDFTGGRRISVEHPTPEECSGAIPPERFSVSTSCPSEDGTITASFTFEPAITWDSVLFSEHDVTAGCTRVDLNHMSCTVPNIPSGDHYEFTLHGTGDGDGQTYTWAPWAPLPEDCPDADWRNEVFSSCMEGLPVVEIHTFGTSVTRVSSAEDDLDCIGMAPGVQICTLEGEPGSTQPLAVCFTNGMCETQVIDVLACSETPTPLVELVAGCMETAAYLEVHTPIGVSSALQSVRMGDTELDCSAAPFGFFCTGLPNAPGLDWSTDVCFTDGACLNNTVTIPDCGAPESVHFGWWLEDVGCHNEERAYIIVHTNIEDFTGYRYNMNTGGFGCEPLPEGRVYCSFPLPGPDPLQFCLRPPGDDAESTCTTFDDYASRAPVRCVTPEPPPAPACSSYTNPSDCTANGCNWDKQTSTCSE